ncbi:MAG: PQQ-binding-like beta-propeller repeat protein [Verrucomicrobiota bacterium]
MKWGKASGWFGVWVVWLCGLLVAEGASGKPPAKSVAPVVLVVMDPLAKELACACMKGYGQRDYRKLAARLGTALKQEVSIEFSDDLAETMAVIGPGQEVVVIGEHSKVLKGAKTAGLKVRAVSELTDQEGETVMTGSIVAQAKDTAKEMKDITGRKIFFGLADTEANQAALSATLQGAGLKTLAQEKRDQYTDAALDVLDSTETALPVAVIPSYALRLLEGCGSVKPGELKVLGKTQAVPFITVFLNDAIASDKEQKILKSLFGLKDDAKLLKEMESRDGFRPVTTGKKAKPQARAGRDWPDWRGPNRDGLVPQLPARLPEKAKIVWKKGAMPSCLAGLSVSGNRLILAERDFADEHDVYRCLNTENGEFIWRVEYPARGHLDYGQSPRATPVIHQDKVYLLGAFGELRCVTLAEGKLIWKRDLPTEFEAQLPTWGMSATPLVVDDMLIVNPGGAKASLVALDCATGKTRWATPGSPAAYAAFICGEFGGHRQIVGYDQHSLGGWDVKTGKRLWQLVPPSPGDFNVPTPIAVEGGLVVTSENNGTRFYRFDDAGRIIPEPVGVYKELAPDSATPVVTRGRVYGAHNGLHSLSVQNGLKPVWQRSDDAAGDFATLIADGERLLMISLTGELVLLDASKDECVVISRLKIFEDDVEVYSHPALVGTRLYLRGGMSVLCVELAAN